MPKLLLTIYTKAIRPFTSFILYRIWLLLTKQGKGTLDFNQTYQNFYSAYFRPWDYKDDPAKGFFDFSIEKPEDYFRISKTGRDCDDAARAWYWWGQKNLEEVYEVFVIPDFNVFQAHAITIGKDKKGSWYLFDYVAITHLESFEEAISFEKRIRYYNSKKLSYCINKKTINGVA